MSDQVDWERMHFHENELRGKAELERDRYKYALEAVVRHADMPAGEAWERAYIEVTTIARAALAVETGLGEAYDRLVGKDTDG